MNPDPAKSLMRAPCVFISRTTTGLKALADEIAVILRERGFDPIIQTGFLPDWRSVPQMLQDKLLASDSVIALIGPVHGGEPDHEPARLRDPRTHGRSFSFTQWEFLVARDLSRPLFTFIVSGPGLVAPFEKETADREQRQQQFIADFPKDRSTLYYDYTDRSLLLDHIRKMEMPINVSAGLPQNLPYTTLGTLFKGREQFLADLRTQLAKDKPTVIRGRQAIHGMGGVGKTRAAVEYAWHHAADYRALLFVAADTPDALQRNLATLCGSLVLNLPEQTARETDVQLSAVLRWLNQNPGWLFIIDNVDTSEAQRAVAQLLGQLPEGHIVITSRLADWPAGVAPLDLDVLDEPSSIAFLLERTADRRISHDDDPATAASIARMLDCLALALEQSAAYIRHRRCTLAAYVADWQSKRQTVLAWHDADKIHYPRSIAITYQTSVAQLSEDARQLFRILSWIAPDPIPLTAIEHLKAFPNPRILLIELADLHLARLSPNGSSATVHRLLQEITRQQHAEPKPEPLLTALHWVNEEMPDDIDDVRTWPIAAPLVPHAVATATFGADRDIPEPSAELLNDAAVLMDSQANYLAAEPLYRRTLAIKERAECENEPLFATYLGNFAQLLQVTNRFVEAEPLLRRALAIDEACFGAKHTAVATDLINLAQLLTETNRHGEAEPLIRRALAIDEASYGSEHPQVARDIINLASLSHETNRLAEAEPLIRRALAIDEAGLGKDHPGVATDLNTLASLLQETNRFDEAEPLIRRALAIDEASYGSEHPEVARDLINLALLLHETNRLAEAEPLIRRALAIDEASYGSEHPEVATDLGNLASLLQDTNRISEAEPLLRRALAIHETSYGSEHPNVARDLINLAYLLQTTNCHAEAEPMIRRALTIDEASYGKEHPEVARDLISLAVLLQKTNCFTEAEPLIRRALAIDEASFGKEHPKVAGDLYDLASLLLASNRYIEAELLIHRALELDEASYGSEHPEVGTDLGKLAELLQLTNRLAEAECPLRRQLQIFLKFTRETGHGHPDLMVATNNYAALLRKMGDTTDRAEEKISALKAKYGVTE